MINIELKELLTVQAQLLTTQAIARLSERDEKITELADLMGKFISHITVQAPPSAAPQITNEGSDKNMGYFIPKGCCLFQRKSDGRWDARMYIDGVQKSIACCKNKAEAYKKLKQAYKDYKKPKVKKEKELTLFSWLDHWHNVYRKPKLGTELSKNTIIMDISMIKKIKTLFKDVRLKDLKADYIQEVLNSMTQGRTCEGVYTILKLALGKAKDRLGYNIMELVEKVKHERIKGRALSKEEIEKLLEAAQNDMERNVIKFYIYTGCRVDEISATKVNYINFTHEPRIITGLTDVYSKPVVDMTLLPNEILIHGTKTKGSIRTMPIMPQLRPILEKLIADRDGEERLFPYTTVMIRNFHKLIKDKTKINFTLKDYRHTCATNFKDAGIPSGVYFRWFGWCDDTMAKRVYTHETDYEKKLSLEWAEKFESPR